MRTRNIITLAVALLLALSTSTAMATSSFNADGMAIAQGVRTRYVSSTDRQYTVLSISNTTDCDVTCKVTFYDQDGNDITSSFVSVTKTGGTSTTSSSAVSSTDGEFSLPALSTYYVNILSSSQHCVEGFATIEWACGTRTIRKALMATSRLHYYRTSGWNSMEHDINGGQLF